MVGSLPFRSATLGLALVGGLWAVGPVPVHAQEAAGHVSASLLASLEGDFGSGLAADLWAPIGPLRLGGFMAVGALPSADDTRNRLFMPVGASVAVDTGADPVGVLLRARGGLWIGATQDTKLTAGGFVSGGAYLTVRLGPGVAATLGADLWGVFGAGAQPILAPGVGLSWAPPPAIVPEEAP